MVRWRKNLGEGGGARHRSENDPIMCMSQYVTRNPTTMHGYNAPRTLKELEKMRKKTTTLFLKIEQNRKPQGKFKEEIKTRMHNKVRNERWQHER